MTESFPSNGEKFEGGDEALNRLDGLRVLHASNTSCAPGRNYQIPPDLNETMPSAA
ncbi:hypothetical protein [Variovorax sp. WS11]|uniref:hypothetical protein n=1 Tax=Variovorax sp. WS11 TaxID=1105204 RepID=UPI0013D929AF|nr:hypothetical protein [Variovorax sp. WS11]NDZ15315.1 hypothetical protein [Variovorax sp. WS11]